MQNDTITLAFTGASGLQYGMRLLECLIKANKKVYLLFSQAAHAVAIHELDFLIPKQTTKMQEFLVTHLGCDNSQLQVFDQFEWTAPIASGSHAPAAMVICPCSSGTLAAIAHGMSNNLIERAADVVLKENKKLILVPRETPLSLIHVENMQKLLAMNVILLPASPGFYHKPTHINDLIDFIVARILDQLGIEQHLIKRWGTDL
ncbi:MAG: UbiX family flavin prenyltransferase [Gammaproteobacteria bacterium]|nr:UbiX family flavin prenyltransferase [Gammaproteobacteria bacterium]